jgi:hypothetical protein
MTSTNFYAEWQSLAASEKQSATLAFDDAGWVLKGILVEKNPAKPTWINYAILGKLNKPFYSAFLLHEFFGVPTRVCIDRTNEGVWTLNDVEQPGLEDLTELDFGFTPATNWFTLRRLGPELGVRHALPVVWWNFGEQRLIRLPLFYTRRSATTVWYESPVHEFAALLEVSPDGFVRSYPGLWERVMA